VISDFRREVDENCPLLSYYADYSDNTYRRFGTTYGPILKGREPKKDPVCKGQEPKKDPICKGQEPKKDPRPFKVGPIGCPEMSVRN